ncbi:MAG: enoyl-[acyl-carrier-protein] reductase FabK [Deltaproteobacteria bacterium]|nr:enoyl-[acyl-carrier-protein] reductase FabK [Deltaproteobacteria bacterium]
MRTRVTKLLQIQNPVIMGGMAWIGTTGLAASVSRAGGLGVLGASTMSGPDLEKAISMLRDSGITGFGVNISLVAEGFEDLVRVVERAKVPVVTVSGGDPRILTGRLKDSGAIVLHVVPSPRLAEKACYAGVDIVIAEGVEAGGHVGGKELPLFALLPMVKKTVDIPVVAAGGIGSGRAMAAAFCLGAEAVQIGTLFAASRESPASRIYKEMLVKAGVETPVIYGRNDQPARALLTPVVEKLVRLDRSGAKRNEIRHVRGLGRARAGLVGGDLEQGIFPAGLSAAWVDSINSVSNIMSKLLFEFIQAGKELQNE